MVVKSRAAAATSQNCFMGRLLRASALPQIVSRADIERDMNGSRSERLLDICEERLSAHRAIDHARRRHPIPAQAGYEGKGFPVSLRYAANQSLAARAPAAQPDHFRIGRGLVDEHQSGGIKHGLPSFPASTYPGHVRAILLRGAQAFF